MVLKGASLRPEVSRCTVRTFAAAAAEAIGRLSREPPCSLRYPGGRNWLRRLRGNAQVHPYSRCGKPHWHLCSARVCGWHFVLVLLRHRRFRVDPLVQIFCGVTMEHNGIRSEHCRRPCRQANISAHRSTTSSNCHHAFPFNELDPWSLHLCK